MSRKVTITVLPSSEHPDYLTVQDAMLQIADLFALLKSEVGDEFDWKLVSASTNSPFTAVGEIVAKRTVSGREFAIAELAAQESYQALTDVLAGEEPSTDVDEPLMKRILARNLNGVGLTKVQLDDLPQVDITPVVAETALKVFGAPEFAKPPKRVRGTLEGELVDAGTYRRQPALKLKERARGRVFWCKIPEDQKDHFAEATSLNDVWKNARVRLRGWIEYSQRGEIRGMTAEVIQHVRTREVRLGELHDGEFTGGLGSIQYVDRLRDGDLG